MWPTNARDEKHKLPSSPFVIPLMTLTTTGRPLLAHSPRPRHHLAQPLDFTPISRTNRSYQSLALFEFMNKHILELELRA